eukprot:2207426-Rhodomonas_salina.1
MEGRERGEGETAGESEGGEEEEGKVGVRPRRYWWVLHGRERPGCPPPPPLGPPTHSPTVSRGPMGPIERAGPQGGREWGSTVLSDRD